MAAEENVFEMASSHSPDSPALETIIKDGHLNYVLAIFPRTWLSLNEKTFRGGLRDVEKDRCRRVLMRKQTLCMQMLGDCLFISAFEDLLIGTRGIWWKFVGGNFFSKEFCWFHHPISWRTAITPILRNEQDLLPPNFSYLSLRKNSSKFNGKRNILRCFHFITNRMKIQQYIGQANIVDRFQVSSSAENIL